MDTLNPLRLRRIAKAMTQAELAKQAGISQQLLSKLEAGSIQIKVERAIELAAILECRPAEIMPSLAMTAQPETESAQELELLAIFRNLPTDRKTILFSLAKIMQDELRATAN